MKPGYYRPGPRSEWCLCCAGRDGKAVFHKSREECRCACVLPPPDARAIAMRRKTQAIVEVSALAAQLAKGAA